MSSESRLYFNELGVLRPPERLHGRYTLAGIPRTRFTLATRAVGYLGTHQAVVLAEHGVFTVHTRLQPAQQGAITIVELSTEDATTYAAHSEVEVQVVLANRGARDAVVQLSVTILDASGALVEQYPAVVVPAGGGPASALLPIAAHSDVVTEVAWLTGSHAPGAYQLIVQAHDPATASLLAERGLLITVEPTLAVAGAVTLTPPITHLASQTPVAMQARLTNRGNQPLTTAVTATVTMKNPGYPLARGTLEVGTPVPIQGPSGPRGLAQDAAGNLYVAGDAVVRKVSPQGVVSTIATGLSLATDVAFGPQGEIYALDYYYRVLRMAANGTRTEFHTGLSAQSALTVLADGTMLVAHASGLHAVTPAGTARHLMGTGLTAPEDLAVDRQGTVWVADRGGNRIVRLAGGQLSPFVDGINQPSGAAIDAANTLYVTSFGSNSLLRVTPDGTVSTLATGLAGPQDVALLPSGDLVVSNSNSHSLVTVSPTGAVSTLVPHTLNDPQAAAYDQAGNLYVGNARSQTVVQLTPAGTAVTLAGGLAPRALLATTDGSVTVLEADRLRRISAAGQVVTLASPLASATDLVAAPDGDGMLVSETLPPRIRRVQASGQMTPYLDEQFTAPCALRLTPDGDLILLSCNGYVTTVTAQGTVRRLASGLGSTRGLARAADGTLYVGDVTNRRVLAIAPGGAVQVAASLPFTPGALALTAQDVLLVTPAGGNTLYRVDAAGATEHARFPNTVSADLAVASDGAVWATHDAARQVSRLAPDGTVTTVASGGLLFFPRSLAPDNAGGVYVGTAGGVYRLASTGVLTPVAVDSVLQSRVLEGLGVAADGHLWAVDSNSMLYAIAPGGAVRARYSSLHAPRGMATRGTELFITSGNNTVSRLRAPDQLLEVVADGPYSRLAAEPTGTLLLTAGTGVKRLDPESRALTDVLTGSSALTALAVSPQGTLAVADTVRNELGHYHADGRLLDRFVGLVSPGGLALDSSGQLLVTNRYPNSLLRIRPDGRAVAFAAVSDANYIAVAADGRLRVSRDTSVETLSPTGAVLQSVPSPRARGLAYTPQGTLLVASANEGALLAYAADGSSRKIASGLSQPADMAVNAAGVVHIADTARGVVSAWDGAQTLTLVAGEVPEATALAFDQDTLYVAYGGNKIAVITAAGQRTDVTGESSLPATIRGLVMADGTGSALVDTTRSLYRLRLATPGTGPQPGDVLYSVTLPMPPLAPDAPAVTVDLGTFLPSSSGDFRVEVVAQDHQVTGQLANTLHVGARAEGTLALAQPRVSPGDQPVRAQLRLVGADSSSVTTIDPQGTTLAAVSNAYGRAIAADSSGNIYAADTARIVKMTPTGQVSTFVSGLTIGNGLAVDHHDHLYAVSGRSVLQITPAGTVRPFATFAGTVTAVATDAQGALYAVDSSNTLSRLPPDGSVTPVSTLGLANPQGLTIDAFGRFYVLNANKDMVKNNFPDWLSRSILATE